jgi:hypothetical protein
MSASQGTKRKAAALVRAKAYYVRNRVVVCARLRAKRKQVALADPEGYRKKERERRRIQRKKNPERSRAEWRKRNGLPPPTRPVPLECECGCGRSGVLHADHDHVTGVFRGWLYRGCNLGLGMLGDDLAAVERIAAYLRRVP